MANTCDSVDWYEGDVCVLDADHYGDHSDQCGMTWMRGAGASSLYRVNGPWWPEMGHTLASYLPEGLRHARIDYDDSVVVVNEFKRDGGDHGDV